MSLPILTSKERLCTRPNCNQRILKSGFFALAFKATLIQGLFLMLLSAFGGSQLALLVHAQSATTTQAIQGYQIQDLKDKTDHQEGEITELRGTVNHQGSEISTMEGIGIGFAAVLTLLQLLQMAIGRQREPAGGQ